MRVVESITTRVRPAYLIAAACAAYWLIAVYVPYYYLIQLLNGAFLGVTSAILFGYGRHGFRMLFDHPDEGGQLVLGVTIAWLAAFGQRVWLMVWRAEDEPLWMLNSKTWAFLFFLQIIGAMLHTTAREAIKDRVPPSAWIRLGALVGIGLALAWILIVLIFPHLG